MRICTVCSETDDILLLKLVSFAIFVECLDVGTLCFNNHGYIS